MVGVANKKAVECVVVAVFVLISRWHVDTLLFCRWTASIPMKQPWSSTGRALIAASPAETRACFVPLPRERWAEKFILVKLVCFQILTFCSNPDNKIMFHCFFIDLLPSATCLHILRKHFLNLQSSLLVNIKMHSRNVCIFECSHWFLGSPFFTYKRSLDYLTTIFSAFLGILMHDLSQQSPPSDLWTTGSPWVWKVSYRWSSSRMANPSPVVADTRFIIT